MATFAFGVAYLVWLLLSRNLLEPIPIGGTPIKLDLLQTLAFFLALTALEGTIIVTTVHNMYEFVTEIDINDIRRDRKNGERGDSSLKRRQARLGDNRPSRIQQLLGFGRWIRYAILVLLAILIVRQGFAAASPSRGGGGATVFSIDGWLGTAWSISWVVLVFAVTSVLVHLYAEVRHVAKIQDEVIDSLEDEIKRLRPEVERLAAEAERLEAELEQRRNA